MTLNRPRVTRWFVIASTRADGCDGFAVAGICPRWRKGGWHRTRGRLAFELPRMGRATSGYGYRTGRRLSQPPVRGGRGRPLGYSARDMADVLFDLQTSGGLDPGRCRRVRVARHLDRSSPAARLVAQSSLSDRPRPASGIRAPDNTQTPARRKRAVSSRSRMRETIRERKSPCAHRNYRQLIRRARPMYLRCSSSWSRRRRLRPARAGCPGWRCSTTAASRYGRRGALEAGPSRTLGCCWRQVGRGSCATIGGRKKRHRYCVRRCR